LPKNTHISVDSRLRVQSYNLYPVWPNFSAIIFPTFNTTNHFTLNYNCLRKTVNSAWNPPFSIFKLYGKIAIYGFTK